MDTSKTIIQLSTPRATGAVHVIRISGKQSLYFLKTHTRLSRLSRVLPRRVYLTSFYGGLYEKGTKKTLMDQVLCFYMCGPASYTGEDMVEVHCHGSLYTVEAILKVGLREGLVLAKRGEFTRRAVLNGKMQLQQAEAVNVLISAQSTTRRQQALSFLMGKASLRLYDLEESVLNVLSQLEASIEFPEEDIPISEENKQVAYEKYGQEVNRLIAAFEAMRSHYQKGMQLESGMKVLLMGRTNAGKSTLMNALLRYERVLVSRTHGTTRDFVHGTVELEGVLLTLIDSAGVRLTRDAVEQQGIQRSLEQVKQVDKVIYLLYSKDCVKALKRLFKRKIFETKDVSYYLSKSDLILPEEATFIRKALQKEALVLSGEISLLKDKKTTLKCIEGDLEKWIRREVEEVNAMDADRILLNERHGYLAHKILIRLRHIEGMIRNMESEEILVEEFLGLREYFSELNLSVENEALYDKIFGDFCLGK